MEAKGLTTVLLLGEQRTSKYEITRGRKLERRANGDRDGNRIGVDVDVT